MEFSNITALLTCDPSSIATAEFVGTMWESFRIRNAVMDLANDGQLDLGAVRERLPALLQRLRIDPKELNSIDWPLQEQAMDRAFGADWSKSPSPLLALALLTVAFERTGTHPTNDELEILTAYSVALLLYGLSFDDDRTLNASIYISDICRVYNKAGALDMSLQLAQCAVSRVRMQSTDTSVVALPDLLDSLYDARTSKNDAEPPVDNNARRQLAEDMLKFIDKEMTPALEARNALFGRVSPEVSPERVANEIRRSSLALQYRRITQESARLIETVGWDNTSSRSWKALIEDFESLRNFEGLINAVNATSAYLDSLLKVPSNKRDKEWGEEVRRLVEYLREGIKNVQIRQDQRALLLRVVKAAIELQDTNTSEAVLRCIETSLREELNGLKGRNEATRSYLLSGADDYLGLALQQRDPSDQLVRDMFEMLRGYELPHLKQPASASLVRLFVTRKGSLIQLLDEHPYIFRGTSSHELAVLLHNISRLIGREIKENKKTKSAPGTANEWREHVEQLSGRIGVSAMAAASKSPERLLIEVDGLAVHVAISGLFLNEWPDIQAIAATQLGHNVTTMALPENKRTVVINCFSRGEAWSGTLEKVGRTLGATDCRVTTTDKFLAALHQDASLFIVGAHGHQDGVAGALTLSIGGEKHLLRDLLSNLQFAKGVTVVAVVCYGASGEGHFAGQWNSLPAILTSCGARWVIANRWPAWTEPATEADFIKFMKELEICSVSNDVWTVPLTTTTFMKTLKEKGNDPRQWAGWTAWSAVDELWS